ncbi:MAG: aryl sulfotransferase, partial [Chloroflexi bacterium]|nr:aryl sulfotransferase [Chloroflexota bacterium]
LPNRNTLICEGCFGRIFEVTESGELVWEYVSPYVHPSPFGENNWVFRALRYGKEEIQKARR